MEPRLRLDIGWGDLLSTLAPVRDAPALEGRVAAFAPARTTALVGLSVRTLFDALLAETAAGRPVVMSAVTVADMAALVREHGCALRPVDIDLDTLAPTESALAEAAGEDAALVVLAHLYGRRAAVDTAFGAARPLLVEDCAQAFDGRLTLSPGTDVALYSFGPIKTATALGGAVALFRDPGLAGRIAARLAAYPVMSDGWFRRRVFKYAVLKVISTPVFYGGLIRILARGGRDPDTVIGQAARGFAGSGPLVEALRRAPPPRLLRLLARRLAHWTPRPPPGVAAAAASGLAALAIVPGHAAPGGWWVMPVLCARPERLVAALRRRGLDATRGATSLRVLAADGVDPPREASRLMAEVVYVPKPVDGTAVDRLVHDVAGALEETRP